MSLRQAFILLTTKHSSPVLRLFENIQAATTHLGDACIMYHQTSDDIPVEIKQFNHHVFTNNILHELNYVPITTKLVPGSNHFPLLDFYLKNPHYDHYWYIEDDVRFTGNWKEFFNHFDQLAVQPDFISSHVRIFQEEPSWSWWLTLSHPRYHIPSWLLIRSFNPIMRISNKALKYIHQALTDKWQGHHEVLLPTLLCNEGFHVTDFGGTGLFVEPDTEEKFYITVNHDHRGTLNLGSMRFRPVIGDETLVPNKLYHPVKE